jgi:hypothetical protein
MQIRSHSGQVVRLDLLTDQIGIIDVDVDRPRLAVRFFGASESLVENHCVVSTADVFQTGGSHALSVTFRIPFVEQGVNGEINATGETSVNVVSEITITGAVTSTRVEVI